MLQVFLELDLMIVSGGLKVKILSFYEVFSKAIWDREKIYLLNLLFCFLLLAV